MSYFAKASELIKEFEGLKLKAYRCPAGVLTIGWGHTGSDVHSGMEISLEEAESFLMDDMMEADQAIFDYCEVDLSDNERAALISFIFNLGAGAFRTSTLLRLLNIGDHNAASKQFARWTKAKGMELPGLVRRREAERKLFVTEEA